MKVYVLLEWSEWEGVMTPSIKGVFPSPEAAKAASGEGKWDVDWRGAPISYNNLHTFSFSIEEHTLLD